MFDASDIVFPTGQNVKFYGFQVIGYYLKKFFLYYSDYPWTIRLLYEMVILCIISMLVVFALFLKKTYQSHRADKEYSAAKKDLLKGFYDILVSTEKPDGSSLEKACGMPQSEILAYNPQTLSRLISEICMDLSRELAYIPNANALCSLTGVKSYYEKNLANHKKVLVTLQDLAIMHIPVNDGLLAVYLNYYDISIRHMARICHITSSAEPYRYLYEDLNDHLGLWYQMMLHRAFAWERFNERQMPQFLVIAKNLKNEDSAAFLIQETAYWGSEIEKGSLHEFFLSPNFKYRKAALHAVAIMRDANQEQAAIDSYEQQPEEIRQEVLKTIYAINSGKHTKFFVDAFRKSTTEATREIALTSLYTYGRDGRRTFELLREECMKSNTDRTLMDQIDSFGVLNQMRTL